MIFSTMLSVAILGQVVLPGNNMSLERAQEQAHMIVVAEPIKFNIMIGIGAAMFTDADLKRSVVLKGKVKEEELKRASVVATGHETFPEQGEEYIFFLNEYAGHLNILKVLSNTKENIEAARKEIKAKEKPGR